MLTTLEKVNVLKNAPIFAEIPTESLARVAAIAQEVNWKARHMLFLEDDPADSMFLLLEGQVEVARSGQRERRAHAPQVVGALAVLAGKSHPESAMTLQPTRALQIEQQDFYEALREDFSLTRGILRALVGLAADGA